MSMPKEFVIGKLKEVQTQIEEIKKNGVNYRNSAEFSNWKQTVSKWLKAGHPHTIDELGRFERLDFYSGVLRMGGVGYGHRDQEEYLKDCDKAGHIINSAIENLELDLVTELQKTAQSFRSESKSDVHGGVRIGQAETVVVGNENIVSIVNSVTIEQLFDAVGNELQKNVKNAPEHLSAIQRFKELCKNPAFAVVLGQTVGEFLRRLGG